MVSEIRAYKVVNNIQCEGSLMLFADNLMLHPGTLLNIHNGLVIVWDLVRANNIVLALCKTGWARRSWRQSARVFKIEELDKFCLYRLLKEDLSEVDDLVVMLGKDNISCLLCLLNGENLERMNGSHVLGSVRKRHERE